MVNYRYISCCFSLVCFLLFLLAHCSHNWRAYQTLTGFYTMGLWSICSDKTGCKKLQEGHASIELTRVFMLLALIASFMAFIWAVDWDHLFHCNFTFLPKALIASACNFVAGMSALIGLVMFEIEGAKVPDRKTSFKDWAFYLTCVAGVVCLLTGTLDLVAYKYELWGLEGSHCHVGLEHKEATATPTVAPALL